MLLVFPAKAGIHFAHGHRLAGVTGTVGQFVNSKSVTMMGSFGQVNYKTLH
jgi:hypothetical protein